jgi:hypothetical protein
LVGRAEQAGELALGGFLGALDGDVAGDTPPALAIDIEFNPLRLPRWVMLPLLII